MKMKRFYDWAKQCTTELNEHLKKEPKAVSVHSNIRYAWLCGLFIAICLSTIGCTPPPVPYNPDASVPQQTITEEVPLPQKPAKNLWETDPRFLLPGPIPEANSRNEGSLWGEQNSWGNLLRDKKATFAGDLLQVTGVNSIIPQTNNQNPVTRSILPIQQNINEISVKIEQVLSNGLLAIVGERTDYEEGTRVRYHTLLRGYISPQDISNENTIDAKKINQLEFSTTKAYQQEALPSVEELYDLPFNPNANPIELTNNNGMVGNVQNQPAQTADPFAQPVQPAQAGQPVQPAQAAQPVQPVQATQPVQPVQAVQPANENQDPFVQEKPVAPILDQTEENAPNSQ